MRTKVMSATSWEKLAALALATGDVEAHSRMTKRAAQMRQAAERSSGPKNRFQHFMKALRDDGVVIAQGDLWFWTTQFSLIQAKEVGGQIHDNALTAYESALKAFPVK